MDYSGFINDKTPSHLSKKKKFLYVGHIRSEKGVPLLIEAWRALSVGNSELTIAGNIVSEGISKEALDPPDTVRFELGYVQDLRMVQLMLEADF